MKRIYGIGFLIAVGLLIIFLGIFMQGNLNEEMPQNVEIETSHQEKYFLKDENGYVIVYNGDGTIYDYTTILVNDLPPEIRQAVTTGMELQTVEELYGFLENYSS